MSLFRNFLNSESTNPSYIKLAPETIDFLSEEDIKTLIIESNDSWNLHVNYK